MLWNFASLKKSYVVEVGMGVQVSYKEISPHQHPHPPITTTTTIPIPHLWLQWYRMYIICHFLAWMLCEMLLDCSRSEIEKGWGEDSMPWKKHCSKSHFTEYIILDHFIINNKTLKQTHVTIHLTDISIFFIIVLCYKFSLPFTTGMRGSTRLVSILLLCYKIFLQNNYHDFFSAQISMHHYMSKIICPCKYSVSCIKIQGGDYFIRGVNISLWNIHPVKIWEKIYCVITAPHCIILYSYHPSYLHCNSFKGWVQLD